MAARTPSPVSGRSPMVALTGARPATCLTQAAMVSGVSAPSAPCSGSFRSTMSAPARSANSASSASRTLARNRVNGTASRTCHHHHRPAAATARGAAVVGGRGIGPLEAPEIVTRGGRPLPHLAQLNLVLVPVGIGDDDRDSLPVPLRGRVSPGMRFDGDDLIRARVDDGDIFEARILTVAEIARVIFQKADARERVLQELPLEDLRAAPSRTFQAPVSAREISHCWRRSDPVAAP